MSFFGDIWKFVSGTPGDDDSGSNNLLSYAFYNPETGKIDFAKTAGILGGIASATGLTGSGTPPPVGYQGKIPDYEATRSRVANTYDPNRRAGSGGQRYFSDMRFTPKGIESLPEMDQRGPRTDQYGNRIIEEGASDYVPPQQDPTAPIDPGRNPLPNPNPVETTNFAITSARALGNQQALGLAAANLANPARQTRPAAITPYSPSTSTVLTDTSGPASGVVNLLPAIPDYTGDTLRDVASRYIDVSDNYITPYSQNAEMGRGSYAAGGIAKLREGRYLAGATDGMADKIPAEIDQVQPAALSDGEYVIPADVVSHLGNGNSDAGAEVLDEFLTKVRKSRTGNGEQGKEIDPNKLLPKVA